MRDVSNLHRVWERFFDRRTKDLDWRFPGRYRAVVVETNDPLQIYRVRYKCPELHDFTLKPEECPWAVPDPKLGSKVTGSWEHPCIGDIIWVEFEKGHPYGPVWTGFAMGTRRKRYPLDSIFTKSPLSVDQKGKAADKPNDFLEPYLAKDFRPMQTGWQDRYGNSELNNAIGFIPKEHRQKPAPTGVDAVAKSDFTVGDAPQINDPDRKYMARVTKYGIFEISSDVGYYWKKDGNVGEFRGEDDDLVDQFGKEERQFEIDRYKYFTQLLNEGQPKSEKRDQRRYEIRTRAGHKFEMRDVGWAQSDGGLCGCEPVSDATSRTENGTYGGQVLSKWSKSDERWTKLRTKGGHIIQMMDMGFDPKEDKFYTRKLIEECGPDIDHEKDAKWVSRDSRQIRIVTRWGNKFVLDDRGTDPKAADEKETPRGNGWLLKSRRSWEPGGGHPRGFAIECNDKDDLNTTRWYTPKSKVIEMNDRKDYLMACTDMSKEISRPWKYLDENEFALDIAMTNKPETDTYHLKLDKRNGYIRLKTAMGGDNGRRPQPEPENDSATCGLMEQNAQGPAMQDAEEGLHQGVEMRDGRCQEDGAWMETVDCDHRGTWLTRKYKMGIWRAKQGSDQFIMIHDGNKTIVLRNAVDGVLQLYCVSDIEIISDKSINIKAAQDISLKAGGKIILDADGDISRKAGGDCIEDAGGQISEKAGSQVCMNGGGGSAFLAGGAFTTSVPNNAPEHTGFLPGAAPGPGAQGDTGAACTASPGLPGNNPTPIDQEPREPKDRMKTCNDPFDSVDELVIKQCEGKDTPGNTQDLTN